VQWSRIRNKGANSAFVKRRIAGLPPDTVEDRNALIYSPFSRKSIPDIAYATIGISSAAPTAIPLPHRGTPAAVLPQKLTVSTRPMKDPAFAKAPTAKDDEERIWTTMLLVRQLSGRLVMACLSDRDTIGNRAI
jgi:hypothetical protein